MSIQLVRPVSEVRDPLSALEAAAATMEFEFERVGEGELNIVLPGVWRDIGLWFTWQSEISTLQVGAPIDLKASSANAAEAAQLVSMVNERLWIGHFDLWAADFNIVYRNAMILPANGLLNGDQAEALLQAASEAVDRFYPAFNFFIWGGKTPEDALQASLFETVGNA